jgi:integrase
MAFAGLRRGEVLGLQWGDIDLAAGLIHIRRQRIRVGGRLTDQPTKSRAGLRDVPIADDLRPLLKAAYRLDPRRQVISCAPETLGRRWRRAQEDAAIVQPYRLHDLRHTYATRYALAGCNLKVLQYMVGHSSFELTANTYAHVGAADAVAEVRRLSASLH